MTKNEFLQLLGSARSQWDELWKSVDLGKADESLPGNEMNLRDILYHVAWYEREMISVLQLHTLVGSPWWDLRQDERNARILAEGQSTSLVDAFHEENQVYSELVSLLNGLRDEEFEEARFFRDMPSDWKPWEMLADNTSTHYHQHFQAISLLSQRK